MTYESFPTSALLGVIEALPLQEEWPLHWIDGPKGETGNYCWPCSRRILRRLGVIDEYGWRTDKAQDWDYGHESGAVDSVHPDCDYCGRRLKQHLSDEGFSNELEHFESLTDLEIATADINDIQRLAWGVYSRDTDISPRTHDTLLRFLRARGTPFDPSKYPVEPQP